MILIHHSHTQGPHPRILAIGFSLLYEGCRKEMGGFPSEAWPIFAHAHWHSMKEMQFAPRVLHFSAFHLS